MSIKLGQKVRDTLTGLEGVAISRTEFLYGCVRILVQPHGLTKDGAVKEPVFVDEPQVEALREEPIKLPTARVPAPAGPRTDATRHIDARR